MTTYKRNGVEYSAFTARNRKILKIELKRGKVGSLSPPPPIVLLPPSPSYKFDSEHGVFPK